MKKIILLTIVLVLSLAVAAQAQFSKAGTVGLQFLKIGVGARALGMAQTFTPIADDVSCLFWNPAGIARLEGTHFIGAFNRWFANIALTAAGLSHYVEGVGAFGARVIMLTSGYDLVRTVGSPEGTGETFTFRDWAFGFSYARNLTDRFAFGGTINIVREEIAEYSDTGILVDIGSLYDTGYKGIKIGISITNFGPDLEFKVDDDRDGLVNEDPENDKDDDNDLFIDEDVREDPVPAPLTFRAGISMPLISTESMKLIAAFEGVHLNDNVEQYNIGGEFWLTDMFAIRGGYRTNLDEGGLAFGAGVKYTVEGLGTMMIDYAFNDYGLLGTIHRASFVISF